MRFGPSRALLVSLAPTERPVAGIWFGCCLAVLNLTVNRSSGGARCGHYDTGPSDGLAGA
ncbi:hypothetical protein N9E84_04230 [Planktomarina temperata]|nr:hypothetical protein [Planktomarina temperata]MDB9749236.1 hypothetical protein [Planktomarina temperata]